ncbi:MAG: STAS domain-containing protein [Chitinispirillaceae bacterium]|nr:STAS domain-containing protein [Chitinispirillaceae bacterium]
MDYGIKMHNDIVEIITDGNILQEDVESLRKLFRELIKDGKIKIVLNLDKTNYVSSLCLAVIVDVKNRLSTMKGDLKLGKVNRLIRNLLEITNLIKKIEVFDTIEEALEAFEKKTSKPSS